MFGIKKEGIIFLFVLFLALISYSGDVDAVACRDVGYCSGLPHSSQGSSTARDSQDNTYCYYKAVVAGASGCAGRTCYEQDKVICNPPNTCTATGCQTGGCNPNWECSNWGTCGADGFQSRSCTDKSSCGTTTGRPELLQRCTPGQPASQPTTTTSQPVTQPTATGPETCYDRNIGEKCVDLCNAKGQTCVYNNKFSDQPCSKGKGAGALGATGGSEFNVPCTRAPAGDVGKCAYWCKGATTPSQPAKQQPTKKTSVSLAKVTTSPVFTSKIVACEGFYDLNSDGKVNSDDFFIFADKFGKKDMSIDYTKNKVVDVDDFSCFRNELGSFVTVTPAQCITAKGDPDADYDGDVDFDDLFKFIDCSTGKGAGCEKFDFDENGKVELGKDFSCFRMFAERQYNCLAGCGDINFDDKTDLKDFFNYASCFGKSIGDKTDSGEICAITDYNADKKLDELDFVCFKKDFNNKCSCNNKKGLCSDIDKDGEVGFQDLFSFLNCFGSSSNECLSKFNYNDFNGVDAGDFICLKKDFDKSVGSLPLCAGRTCSTNVECGTGNYYCSNKHCCANEYYWDSEAKPAACIKRRVKLCDCPYQNDANGFYRVSDGKRVSSKEFTKDPRCWDSPLKSACAFVNKGFGLEGKEKRLEEVKVYRQK